MDENVNEPAGMDRRTLIKRGAVVGGSLVWATPVVQSIARPAFAAESPGGCSARVEVEETNSNGTTCSCTSFPNQPEECCTCIEQQVTLTNNAAIAVLVCFGLGKCVITTPTACSCS